MQPTTAAENVPRSERRALTSMLARPLGLAVAVGLGYALGSKLSYWWFNANGLNATFFPAAGVTLAALVLSPRRSWAFVLAGAATAEVSLNLWHGIDPGPTLGYALANGVESLVGASLLLALAPRPDLERLRDLVLFLACAVVAAPAVGGTIGATNFVLSAEGSWLEFARDWWVGDGLGVLVVGAAVLAVGRAWPAPGGRLRPVETAAFAAAVSAATAVVFWAEEPVLAFLPFALLLVAAVRLGTAAVAISGSLAAILAAQATADGHVFWETLEIASQTGLLYLQLLVAFVVVTPLLLAAALRSRDVAVAELFSVQRREALAAASAALAAANTEQEVVDAFVAVGRMRLGAARGLVALDGGDELVVRYPADAPEAWGGRSARARRSPAGDALESGHRVGAASPEALRSRYPELAAELERKGVRSVAAVPLPPVAAAPAGAAAFAFAEPRELSADDWELLESLAGSVAQAIARARLYEQIEEQAHAARILSRIGEGVVQVDADGRVVAWNGTAAAITGVDAGRAVGAFVQEVLPGWEEIEARTPVTDADGSHERVTLPVVLGGRTLWLGLAAVAYSDGVVYAFRDETADRDLDRVRHELIATTSHQLRTPLTGLYGAAMTLTREDVALDDDARRGLLDLMVGECERLNALVDEILLAAALDNGSLSLDASVVDVADLLADVARSVEPALPEGIRLVVEAEPVQVRADRDRLRQVLRNLVDNACKYSPDGGTVLLSASRERAHAVLRVSDRGIGIPRHEQALVFERFYRLDPALTRGVGGTGLGLFICRELVHRMGGTIELESEPGAGTSVEVRLPL